MTLAFPNNAKQTEVILISASTHRNENYTFFYKKVVYRKAGATEGKKIRKFRATTLQLTKVPKYNFSIP